MGRILRLRSVGIRETSPRPRPLSQNNLTRGDIPWRSAVSARHRGGISPFIAAPEEKKLRTWFLIQTPVIFLYASRGSSKSVGVRVCTFSGLLLPTPNSGVRGPSDYRDEVRIRPETKFQKSLLQVENTRVIKSNLRMKKFGVRRLDEVQSQFKMFWNLKCSE